MTASYRIRQGLRALFAFSQPVDDDLAAAFLTPTLMHVFRSLRRSEQLHSLKVLRTIQSQGSISPDLAVAALLHDAGKSRYPFPVWQKTLVVLVRAFLPRLFTRLSSGSERNLLCRPFVLSVQHPAWSADQVAAAGGSATAVWLIAHHADPLDRWADHPCVQLLKQLRDADDTN
ncbi:MAG: hypothetical protein K8J31_01925 [Anaerolineae bacterium]|nr:hypothetical protein [Anaerolineae bacterium]